MYISYKIHLVLNKGYKQKLYFFNKTPKHTVNIGQVFRTLWRRIGRKKWPSIPPAAFKTVSSDTFGHAAKGIINA